MGGIQKLHFFLSLFLYASLSCLPIEVISTVTSKQDLISEEKAVLSLFQQWKQKHGKVYKHGGEEEQRFKNFKNSMKYVMERNLEREGRWSFSVGLNKFADMSNEEFKRVYGLKVTRGLRRRMRRSGGGGKGEMVAACSGAPSSLDWRKYGIVTGVKDQGDCGSCWAFSSTGAIEGVNALVNGDLVSLSEQELVDCDTSNYGCEGGYMDYAFEWVISNGGIDSESNYPYTGVDSTCNTTKEETKVVTIDSYQDVEEEDSALLCAVANQPISVGIDGSAFDFQLYTGGIYDGDCSSNPDDIDHAILIVGYGSSGDDDYWIIKNSWGTLWGINGYGYIKRNINLRYGVCAINAMASYPTKESSSPSPYPSPTVPPPPPPPPSPPPPPPPPPSPPSGCGDYYYCPTKETCCCLFEFFDYCLVYGCCEYENAVCCTGTEYCCPSDYPICDVQEGLCLKNYGDYVGVAAKKRKMAKHKFPWTKLEEEETLEIYHSLQWKRNPFAAVA